MKQNNRKKSLAKGSVIEEYFKSINLQFANSDRQPSWLKPLKKG